MTASFPPGSSLPRAEPSARQRWLAVLARAPREALQRLAEPALAAHEYRWLRAPETGLVMLRARIGAHGDRFNLAEAPVTRCVARCAAADGGATAGIGYVLGRDTERAAWVARLDALLQQPAHHDTLIAQVIEPLAAARAAADAEDAARLAPSRVRFDTLAADVGA